MDGNTKKLAETMERLAKSMPQMDPDDLVDAEQRAKQRYRRLVMSDNMEETYEGVGVIAAFEELEGLKFRCLRLHEDDACNMLSWLHRMLSVVLEKAQDPETTYMDALKDACEKLSFAMALLEVAREKNP